MGLNTSNSTLDELVAHYTSLPVVAEILSRLEKELPKNLYYHNVDHTRDVMREALLFGLADKLPAQDLELLALTAAFHDSGYLIGSADHEIHGADIARDALKRYGGYSEEQVNTVEQMILDTKLLYTNNGKAQVSCTPLSGYVLDADLSNLGRDDFFDRSEAQLQEWGVDRLPFQIETLLFLEAHNWVTEIARNLRQSKKLENIAELKLRLAAELRDIKPQKAPELEHDRLQFLARLPLLMNHSLDRRLVISAALDLAKKMVEAEAATLFLKEPHSEELVFWATRGGECSRLEGSRMPLHRGIVGWVVDHQRPLSVSNVQQDPRFFSQVDREGTFKTRNLMCVPLTVRGNTKLGALQLINSSGKENFTDQDLLFTEQLANQLALAIDNAQLHQEAVRRSRDLEELDSRKSEMLRVIAHELKTPVTIIQSAAELLSDQSLTDPRTTAKVKAALMKGVDRITKVAKHINSVSLLGDNVPIEPQKFSLNQLLQEIQEEFHTIAHTRNIKFSLIRDPSNPTVFADRSLIYLVIVHLVSNAFRYTQDAGSITVSASSKSGLAAITVADSGIGFADEQKELVFQKFYGVNDAMHHSSGDLEFGSSGLGLGLSLVKSILEAHKVSILVKSAPNEGSSFTFHLPLQS